MKQNPNNKQNKDPRNQPQKKQEGVDLGMTERAQQEKDTRAVPDQSWTENPQKQVVNEQEQDRALNTSGRGNAGFMDQQGYKKEDKPEKPDEGEIETPHRHDDDGTGTEKKIPNF